MCSRRPKCRFSVRQLFRWAMPCSTRIRLEECAALPFLHFLGLPTPPIPARPRPARPGRGRPPPTARPHDGEHLAPAVRATPRPTASTASPGTMTRQATPPTEAPSLCLIRGDTGLKFGTTTPTWVSPHRRWAKASRACRPAGSRHQHIPITRHRACVAPGGARWILLVTPLARSFITPQTDPTDLYRAQVGLSSAAAPKELVHSCVGQSPLGRHVCACRMATREAQPHRNTLTTSMTPTVDRIIPPVM